MRRAFSASDWLFGFRSRYGDFGATLIGSFIGGAAAGVVMVALLLSIVLVFLGIISAVFQVWFFEWRWVHVVWIGAIPGGVTGLVVALLAKLAHRSGFGSDE